MRENELRGISALLDDLTGVCGAFFRLRPMISDERWVERIIVIKDSIRRGRYLDSILCYRALLSDYYEYIKLLGGDGWYCDVLYRDERKSIS